MEKYKKVGKCNQCGLCCLIHHKALRLNNTQDNPILDEIRNGFKIVKTTKDEVYLAKWDPCPYLDFNLRCTLHNKKLQPLVCRVWPIGPWGFYELVQDRCSIHFEKVDK